MSLVEVRPNLKKRQYNIHNQIISSQQFISILITNLQSFL